MQVDRTPTHRSGLFVLSFQIEGICTALRHAVPYGLPVGPLTIAMLRRFKGTFDSIAKGRPVEDLPDVDENTSPVDVLSVAEVLRATLMAFLSPEEVEERRVAIGFHPTSGNDGD